MAIVTNEASLVTLTSLASSSGGCHCAHLQRQFFPADCSGKSHQARIEDAAYRWFAGTSDGATQLLD